MFTHPHLFRFLSRLPIPRSAASTAPMDLDRAYAAFLASLPSLFDLRCLFRESRLPSALASLEITEEVLRPPTPPGTLSYGLMLLAALPRLARGKINTRT